jgi:hypothetical protein
MGMEMEYREINGTWEETWTKGREMEYGEIDGRW